jgi:hypothetical protein
MIKEARYKELLDQQQESGLTIKEFCSNQGVALATFHYWKKKLLKKPGREKFIPLVVKPSEMELSKGSTCSEIIPGKESLFELVFPNGTVLRVKQELDLAYLRALIHLYD